jgi:hypothetical protein
MIKIGKEDAIRWIILSTRSECREGGKNSIKH